MSHDVFGDSMGIYIYMFTKYPTFLVCLKMGLGIQWAGTSSCRGKQIRLGCGWETRKHGGTVSFFRDFPQIWFVGNGSVPKKIVWSTTCKVGYGGRPRWIIGHWSWLHSQRKSIYLDVVAASESLTWAGWGHHGIMSIEEHNRLAPMLQMKFNPEFLNIRKNQNT
jgi:hypothetical protein